MRLSARTWQKISGIALIVGPLQFVVATLVEGALIPGYSLVGNWISDLGAPPNSSPLHAPGTELWWIFSASLIVMSLLLLVGLVGLRPLLWSRTLGKTVTVLFVVVSLGGIGVAVWNEVDAPALHSLSALVAFGIGWVGLILFGLTVRGDPRWSLAWSVGSIVGGLLSFSALVLYGIPYVLGTASSPAWIAALYPGASERAIVLPLVLWLIAVGTKLLRGVRADTAPLPPSPRPEPA